MPHNHQYFSSSTPSIGKKPDKKVKYLKVEIKTHPVETNSKTVLINVPIFKTRSAKALLKFLFLLKIFCEY